MTMPHSLFEIPVIVTEHALVSKWVFPQDRFIEYEPKDERWCRFFRIRHEVMVPGCYQMDGKLIIHPTLWDQIPKV